MDGRAQALPWGTQWDLVAAADDSVDWSTFRVTLGFQEGRAGGRAPVNRYFGMCRELPEGALELGPFGMTMMAGPPGAMAAETVYLALLERVAGYRLEPDALTLMDDGGTELLVLRASVDPQ